MIHAPTPWTPYDAQRHAAREEFLREQLARITDNPVATPPGAAPLNNSPPCVQGGSESIDVFERVGRA